MNQVPIHLSCIAYLLCIRHGAFTYANRVHNQVILVNTFYKSWLKYTQGLFPSLPLSYSQA